MTFIVKRLQLELALKTIPASIQLIEYNPAHYRLELFSEQQIKQEKYFSQWVLARQAQFLAGRIAAKNALQAISHTPENIAIGKHREPLWPKGIIGSISHSNHVSIATAQVKTEQTKGCGLDIQTIFNQEESTKVLPIILSQQDQASFNKHKNHFYENQLATLIFSAKESYFKTVFNQVKEYFDFNAVSIQSIDLQNKQVILISNASSPIHPQITLTVYYDFLVINGDSHIITYSVY